ncbi:DUF956 family protein [Lacticaseibacillus brantae]|uniref:DUF956 family protein n=1 Tax=Lacticaseibacillus brantae DSM 23927 TaxID=1423727 RepID=A0A0R2B0Y7_9LACO|nr:DUF956 family protein [Lacticaseibacillus brantae]KRM71636.1 hypothetical protein FC34_GL001293 [Lacticaseibacillus brantae DSM 23927]
MVESLNKTVEYAIKVNSMITPNDPKPGVMALGDNGLEYRANNGVGFIQVPWANITLIRAQIMGKKHVRGFFVDLDDGRSLNFVASDAIPALRVMRDHLGSDKLVRTKTIGRTVAKWWHNKFGKKTEA